MIESPIETLLEKLLKAGERPDKDLLQAIQDQGQAAGPRLIEIATDPDLIWAESDSPEVWAPTHAMHLLGRLRATSAIAPMLATIEAEEEADWIREELPDMMAQIGPAAIEPLKVYAADRDHYFYGRSAACNSLVKIAQSHSETRQRVIDFLRTFLPAYSNEKPDDESFRAFVICDLLDLQAKEVYSDIEAAFVEGRVDDMVVGLDDVQKELGILGGAKPRKRAGFELRLKCQECGFVRPHTVDVVYCDLATQERRTRGEETKYSEFIIPQRIICPRCNAVDRYELTSEAHLAMTAELLKLAIPGRKTPGLGDGTQHLRLMRFTIKGGQEMHPLEALEMYQRRVDENPGDVGTRVRYANVLFFLRRWDEARAQFEEAQTRDPSNADTYFGLAQTAEAHEDVETALTMYEEYLARVPRRPKQKDEREAWEYAQDTVEALRRQQAGVLGRVAGTVGQMARTGGKLLGLTDRSGSSTLSSWKDSSQHPAQRQGKKAARQAQRRARKRKRKKKK